MNKEKDENYKVFVQKLPELLEDVAYKDKFVVVCKKKIVAVYDTFAAALEAAVKQYPVTEFIIQQVIDESKIINFIRSAS